MTSLLKYLKLSSLFIDSMWPGLDELKTLSKRMQMEAELEKQQNSRHLKTPPSGQEMSNGFYSGENKMKRASRKITAVHALHAPSMLMPEVAH